MEGYSKINYKNKTIYYSNYSIYQSDPDQKRKTLELLDFIQADRIKQPLNSVLALVNVANLDFDMEILKRLKENLQQTEPYDKKMALIGINGLKKTAYNFVFGLTPSPKRKSFDTELEAKEWLVKED
jgi:hypothetical protein